MGTRAAAFAAKIRNLQDYHTRILNNIFPAPSGNDILNTLKYFSQFLLGILRDVPSIPMELMCSSYKDHTRISMFPNVDYKGLYHVIIQLLEVLPQIQSGMHALGQTILNTMSCLVPFLEHEYMDTLPYIVASSMATLPNILHKDLLDMLCYKLLPFTIVDNSDPDYLNYANMSIPSIMMVVFNYAENTAFHSQLIECLMRLKRDIIKDLLCVIAHGTAKARCAAIELLFQYMPNLNPSALDRKALSDKHMNWTPLLCKNDNCSSTINNEAVKLCIDHTISIGTAERPPTLLICIECADQMYRGRSRDTLMDVLLPMEEIPYNCENKFCKSPLLQKVAISTCFTPECTNYNSNKPIRYCARCDEEKHPKDAQKHHIVHSFVPSPWDMESETLSYLVEAIVSLLKEAQPDKPTKDGERHSRIGFQVSDDNQEVTLEERQLLSRYGVWLLVGLCAPNENTPEEILGRMLSMLCQWFHYTACLPDDQAGNALERLKGESIHGWLMKIIKTHFDVFTACLLPHPMDYARLGGHWECWPSLTNQVKEGFKRLLCLVPYDIITADVWSHIIPYWMECFRHDVPEEELAELKILLSKVLDPDLSPLGLTPKQMYNFISIRFENSTAPIQEQSLYWLQILTMLEVPVPINLLHTMFTTGVKSLSNPNSSVKCSVSKIQPNPSTSTSTKNKERAQGHENTENDQEINLSCYILMLDIIIKQFELQEESSHKGLETKEAERILNLLLSILRAPWVGTHTCRDFNGVDLNEEEVVQCLYCEMCAIFYQLALLLIEYYSPLMEITMADLPTEMFTAPNVQSSVTINGKSDSGSKEAPKVTAQRTLSNEPISAKETEKVSQNDSHGIEIRTAVVSEYEESTAVAIPVESIIPAVARAVTITEDEVGGATCTVSASAQLIDDHDEPIPKGDDFGENFWHTSQGNFKFIIEELHPQYQLVYQILKELEVHDDADVLYHMIYCLKLMSLHAEVLNKAAKNHRGFLIWCQENLLIPNLWSLLQLEFSQISQLCVPLLLHCITLPSGATMFWKVVEDDFKSDNWKARYAAVERVTTIAHFLEPNIKNSPLLQSALANAFCYLVHCLDDIEPSVAQRALLNLESIKIVSLKLLVWCLEVQFDLIIVDRPMLLTTIFQLYNHLSDRRFITWDFFLYRFDALFLEAQLYLENIGELTQTRDLRNTNVNSEAYQKKVSRANDAIFHTHLSRSLSATFGAKLPYKRTLSAPTAGIVRSDRDRTYRQTTVPAIIRKSSKFAAITGAGGTHPGIPDKFQHYPNSFFHDSQLKEIIQEESQMIHVVHRALELEEHDKDTMHLLISLLMQFLSRPDHSHPLEEKSMARNQQIVLHHLNILMGFSPAEKTFLISPNKLRTNSIFNAFITSMPKVLDFNFKMGNILLTLCLPLLVHCASPERYIHDGNHLPLYSLWLLKPHVRQSWLTSVLIILYKHTYNTPLVLKHFQMIIQIAMNTLEAQFHRCRPLHDHMLSPVASRAKDLEHFREQNISGQNDSIGIEEERHSPRTHKMSTGSSEPDDDDKELEAIPESPKSEGSDTCDQQVTELPPSELLIDLLEHAKVEIVTESVEETEPLTIIESVSSANAVVVPIEHEESHTIEKDKALVIDKNKDIDLKSEKQPYHAPVQRVMKEYSPKFTRPKMKRMSAIDGSIKIKKSGESKSNEKEQNLDKKTHHCGLMRNASEGEQNTQKANTKVFRTSSDNAAYIIRSSPETATKSTWTYDARSPHKISGFGPEKPPQERLLPIGMTSKDVRSQTLKDHTGDYHKGVQTMGPPGKLSGDLPFPSCERLLPIGPTPPFSRKEFQIPYSTIKRSAHRGDSIKDGRMMKTPEPIVLEQSTSASVAIPEAIVEPTEVTTFVTSTAVSVSEPKLVAAHEVQPSKPMVKKDVKTNVSATVKQTAPVMVGTAKVVKSGPIQTPSEESPKKLPLTETISQPSIGVIISESHEKEKPLVQQSLSLEPSVSSDMESAPQIHQSSNHEESKTARHYRQRKPKKSIIASGEMSRSAGVAASVSRRARNISGSSGAPPKYTALSHPNAAHISEELVYELCSNCGNAYEEFSEEELGMCIVILGAYIHREPSLAAPIMPDILRLVSRFASLTFFPWQSESNIHLPGSTGSIARQFIRCTLHQLSSNGIFQQIFNAHFAGPDFFKSMSLALADFIDLNQVSPLVELFENLNERKHLPHIPEMLHMLGNVATYLECIPLEAPSQQPWGLFLLQLENFFRKFALLLPGAGVLNLTPLMRIMLCTLKLFVISTCKTILEPYSKILSHSIQQSPLLYEQLLEICNLCCRNFARERDRFILTRTVVYELIQAIKFRTMIPDENLMMIVQFILQDSGGTLAPSVIVENLKMNNSPEIESFNTNACECMRQNVMDLLEFISDVHTLSRVKSNFLGTSIHLNEETLGGHLKAGISQYLSLEMTKNNGSDHRAIVKYLPWLYSLPSLQQGPKEFIDCVSHIRSLSWILLGSLQHSALLHNNSTFLCQPIPLEANTHIAEHIQVILAGFAEQSKASVLHMSSLFHGFILCQLWTMYCENISSQNPPGSDQYHHCTLTLSDFWAKITPGILQLVCHSKVLAETVSLHFLSLMEALMECNSTMLARLLPLWTPVFYSYHGQLSGNTQVRLQGCINWQPPPQTRDDAAMSTSTMLKWLQRMQTKMSQIEMQSSAAIQFYCI